ncbi:MAG: leucine-rich repeat domain-containing protein [Clostridiales bacterium]|nr:leucine-rich repeat domain-containing protein [Clostridiales bacterium]
MPSISDLFSLTNPNAEPNLKAHYAVVKMKMKLGMQNPYEETRVEFSAEHLKTKAGDLREIRGRYDFYVQKMRYLVGELELLWQNNIQSSFIAELENLYGSVTDYSRHVEGFTAFLELAAEALEQNRAVVDAPSAEYDEPVRVDFTDFPELKETRNNPEEYVPFVIPAERKQETVCFIWKLLSKLGITNPHAGNNGRLDPKALKNGAIDMRAIITQYDYNSRKIRHEIDNLLRLWENDTQTSLVEEMEGKMNAVRDFSSFADEYASLLEIAAHEIETNSVEADQASVLSDGSGGAVTVVLSNISYLKRSRFDLKAYDPYYEETQVGVATEVTLSRKNSEYLYNVYEDHAELVKYIGLKKIIEIPAELDGLPVTHIGLDCFAMAWRVKFTGIIMPDTVTTVYHGAFRGCQTIREMNLSTNLSYIGNYAFAFLTDLESIYLPENVVSFGMGAFSNCLNLKSVSIPRSTLKRIGNDCFYGCKKLECVVIGDGVVNIEGWAFRLCEHLKSVTIGENVTSIGESAFYDCIRLNRLDIPEKVSSIGDTAFYSRRGITLGVVEGSAAEKYAVENRINYEHI